MPRLSVRRSLVYAVLVAGTAGCYNTPHTMPSGRGGAGGGGGLGGGMDGRGGSAGSAPIGCLSTCPGPTTGATTGTGVCVYGECRVSCNATFPTFCASSNACVDLTADTKNCGACGHDCLGGACTGSQCQPVMIAQYIGNPMVIYVGAEDVYISVDSGYVGRAKKDGSDLKAPARPGFTSSAYVGTFIAEDGDRVFLTRTGSAPIRLSYCPTTGCDAGATSIGGDYTQYFAVDQTAHRIFWIEYSPSRLVSASTQGSISAVDIPGGTLASGTSGSRLLYSHGGIYFSAGTTVSRIPSAGGVITGVTGADTPISILAANSTLLFLYDGNAIGSVPLPSGDARIPTPVVTTTTLNPGVAAKFAADDRAIYWVSDGKASTCELADWPGTQRSLPRADSPSIWDIGIDDAALYLFGQHGILDGGAVVCAVWKMAR